jgi:BolA-like protein 1
MNILHKALSKQFFKCCKIFLFNSQLFSGSMSRMSGSVGPIETRIRQSLMKLNPVHLEIVNESYMHNVPKDAETHFKVLVVSEEFKGLQLIKRHRMVNGVVKEELKDEFPHALSIVSKAPEEFNEKFNLEPSPSCRGGFGK